MQVGLGLKRLTCLDCSDGELLHEDLIKAFPKLQDGGGYCASDIIRLYENYLFKKSPNYRALNIEPMN